MQLQTQRTNKSGPSWVNLSIGLVLMMNSSCLGQYASLYGNQQAYGYNLNQYELTYAQQQQQQLQQQQQQQYEAAAQSIWSGAPIVVSDNANNYLEQQYQTPTDASSLSASRRQQYSIWGVDPRAAPPPRPIPIPIPTRAANHNYDNVSGHVPGNFYQPVPRPTATATPTEATTSSSHQSELVPSEARRRFEQQEDEEQIVHIGGSRSLATNYNNYNRNFIQPQQQRPQALSQQEYVAKYLQHYANYVLKYPKRLQPIYNDDK